MRDGGKGDLRRKLVIPEEEFNANWDLIFGKAKLSVKEVELEDLDKPLPEDKNEH
jgi:hypothetical protein